MTVASDTEQPPGTAVRPVLEVTELHIARLRRDRTDTVVSSINLSLAPGETVGIVGESGSGKSMTARAIIGLLPPALVTSGEVRYEGRNLLGLNERRWRKVRGREIGLILQDPFTMLNPVMRCGQIIAESLLLDRRLRRGKREEVQRRLAEVGITDPTVVDRYPFQLSGGMQQRVAVAAALARDPRVLIADEPCSALDVTIQREILALIKRIQEARGMALILITHDLRVAFAMCDRMYVLYAGALAEVGPSARIEAEPLHPYTHGLLLSAPPAEHRMRELVTIPGSVPAPDDVAGSCPFSPRCRWAMPRCRGGVPPMLEIALGHFSACIRLPEIRAEMAELGQSRERRISPHMPGRTGVPLIHARDVGKVFQNGNRTVIALDSVSIEVGENESVGLVGRSGSGKTTLARILVGLENATRGEVTISGITASDWSKLGAGDRRKLRRTVQIVFQDPYSSLNPMRTIGWTLGEVLSIHNPGIKNVKPRVEELLRCVGLPASYAQRRPVALSGGERQRVVIARALAVEPRILICDEPVSALDMSVQAQILNLLTALRAERGIAYLFITHDLSILRQISERLYVMHGGHIVESGPTEQVLTEPRDAYTINLLQSVPRSEADWLGDRRSGG